MNIEECAICGRIFNANQNAFTFGKTGEPICPDPKCQAEQDAVTVVTVDD